MKKIVIFDLDGTLADTSSGIYASHQYTLYTMGRRNVPREELSGIIGGPLLETYQKRFGFASDDAKKAVMYYRAYYEREGINGACLYPDIKETLTQLKGAGLQLAVATLKAEDFAIQMLDTLGILTFFDIVYGMDREDTRTKAELIQLCMQHCGVCAEDSLMVGDSQHDATGARECSISFIGVTYGFDFKTEKQAIEAGAIAVANKPTDLTKIILNDKCAF